MIILEFSSLLFFIAIAAGIFGTLTGLGGGLIIIPLLSYFGVSLHHAMGASLVAIITLSLSSSITRTNQRLLNVDVGIFLETGAVMGALVGASLLPFLPLPLISIALGLVLLFSLYSSIKRSPEVSLPLVNGTILHRELTDFKKPLLAKGLGVMFFAGIASGTLGIGSGLFKVLAMDNLLGLPYKVSTSTSNFMVGITATTGIGIYYANNYLDFSLIFPVMIGVFVGGLAGVQILKRAKTKSLKNLFSLIMLIMSLRMLYKGIEGFLHVT